MPDPWLLTKVVLFSALAATLIWWWIHTLEGMRSLSTSSAWSWGVFVGVWIGAWLLGRRFSWPPRQDLDRLLILMIPAAAAFESIVQWTRLPTWSKWLARGVLAAAVAPVVLFGSVYLSESTGVESSTWSKVTVAKVYAGWAALVCGTWWSASAATQLGCGTFAKMAFTITIAVASVVIMLSGYMSGGQMGIPLAAVTGTLTLADLWLRKQSPDDDNWLGVPLIMLAGLLVAGRYFSDLSLLHGVLLLLAPSLASLVFVVTKRRTARIVFIAALMLAVPLTLALIQAAQRFQRRSQPYRQTPSDWSMESDWNIEDRADTSGVPDQEPMEDASGTLVPPDEMPPP